MCQLPNTAKLHGENFCFAIFFKFAVECVYYSSISERKNLGIFEKNIKMIKQF